MKKQYKMRLYRPLVYRIPSLMFPRLVLVLSLFRRQLLRTLMG